MRLVSINRDESQIIIELSENVYLYIQVKVVFIFCSL